MGIATIEKRKRFTNTEGKSNKFYEVTLEHDKTTDTWILDRRWGKIGAIGSQKTTPFPGDKYRANRAFVDACYARARKGYTEVVDRPDPSEFKDISYETDKWTRYAWDWYLRRRLKRDPDWLYGAPCPGDVDMTGFARELFGRLLDDLLPLDDPEPWAAALHQAADECHEFDQLRALVENDRWDAGQAAVTIALHLQQKTPPPPSPANGQSGQGDDGGQGKANGDEQDDEQDDEAMEAWANQAKQQIAEAAYAAQKDAEDGRDVMDGLSWGTGTGGRTNNAEEKAKLAELLSHNPALRRMADMLGRARRVLRHTNTSLVRHPSEQIADIGPGADLARTLPSQFAMLINPKLRMEFLRRFVERSTLTYQLEANQTLGRGPMIILVDVSGSMNGSKETWAKALALTLAKHAYVSRRHAALVTFDDNWRKVYECDPRKGLTQDETVKFLTDGHGGGTNFSRPLEKARELIADRGTDKWTRADIVMITDGCCHVSNNVFVIDWTKWRKETGVRCAAMLVENARKVQAALVDDQVYISDVTQNRREMEQLLRGVLG